MTELAEPRRPLFSNRYGINDRNSDAPPWQQRHLAAVGEERTAPALHLPGRGDR